MKAYPTFCRVHVIDIQSACFEALGASSFGCKGAAHCLVLCSTCATQAQADDLWNRSVRFLTERIRSAVMSFCGVFKTTMSSAENATVLGDYYTNFRCVVDSLETSRSILEALFSHKPKYSSTIPFHEILDTISIPLLLDENSASADGVDLEEYRLAIFILPVVQERLMKLLQMLVSRCHHCINEHVSLMSKVLQFHLESRNS